MNHLTLRAASPLVVLLASIALAAPPESAPPASTPQAAESIAWQNTQDLPIELLGQPLGAPVVKLLPIMQVPGEARYMQPFWYRANGRNVYFCTLDMQTGKVKLHDFTWQDEQTGETREGDHLPVHEIWRTAVADGKLYIGYNVPCWFAVYDPATDTVRNIGKAFDKAITIFRVEPSPIPGVSGILLASANGPTEVAVYDPATGIIKHHGILSDEHKYVYYASHDENWIYGACRGRVPWKLVAKHKATGEIRVLAESPVDGYIKVSNLTAMTMDEDKENRHHFKLQDGWAIEYDPAAEAQQQTPVAAPAPEPAPMPEVLIDEDTVFTEGKITLYYRTSQDQDWKTAQAPMGIEGKGVTRLLAYDDHTIVGTSGSYGPMFRYDMTADTMDMLGLPPGNTYSITRGGDTVYLSGYPSTWFAAADLSKPFTPLKEMPGKPAVENTAPNANPRLIGYIGSALGLDSHTGVCLHETPDGRIVIVAMKHRYFKGFALAVYDPKTGEAKHIDDGGRFKHLGVGWTSVIRSGTKLLISTWVEPNSHYEDTPVPEAAKMFVMDMNTFALEKEFVPFPSEKALISTAELPDGKIAGILTAENYPEPNYSILYLLDLDAEKVLKTRRYDMVITGVTGKLKLPRNPAEFQVGPDGMIWTLIRLGSIPGYPKMLTRIDPQTLDVLPLGRVGGASVFVFQGHDLYLDAGNRLGRLKDIVPVQ